MWLLSERQLISIVKLRFGKSSVYRHLFAQTETHYSFCILYIEQQQWCPSNILFYFPIIFEFFEQLPNFLNNSMRVVGRGGMQYAVPPGSELIPTPSGAGAPAHGTQQFRSGVRPGGTIIIFFRRKFFSLGIHLQSCLTRASRAFCIHVGCTHCFASELNPLYPCKSAARRLHRFCVYSDFLNFRI